MSHRINCNTGAYAADPLGIFLGKARDVFKTFGCTPVKLFMFRNMTSTVFVMLFQDILAAHHKMAVKPHI